MANTTPAPSADTPESIAARVGMLHNTGMRLCGERDIAKAIRFFSEAQAAEIARLTAEVDDLRRQQLGSRLVHEVVVEAAEAQVQAMREALEGLADVVERDCGVSPCAASMAPAEHYLGLARAALSAPPEAQDVAQAEGATDER